MNNLDETADVVMGILRSRRSRIGLDRELNLDTPLFEGGLGLDSIDFLEVFLEIERATGVSLREDTLTEDSVANVGSLIQYVSSLHSR